MTVEDIYIKQEVGLLTVQLIDGRANGLNRIDYGSLGGIAKGFKVFIACLVFPNG